MRKRLRSVAVMLLFVLLGSGCAHVRPRQVTVNRRPHEFPRINLNRSVVDTSEAGKSGSYSGRDYSKKFKYTFDKLVRNLKASDAEEGLILTDVKITCPRNTMRGGEHVLALFTVIPPLGFIRSSHEVPYSVSYTVVSPSGSEVLRRELNDTVSGWYMGCFFLRVAAARKLLTGQGGHIAANSARMVVNDLYEHGAQLASWSQPRAGRGVLTLDNRADMTTKDTYFVDAESGNVVNVATAGSGKGGDHPSSNELPSCAVLTFDNRTDITTEESELLADRLAIELDRTGTHRVQDRATTKDGLAAAEIDPVSGCGTTELALAAGRTLHVDSVVYGTIGKVGAMYTANTYLIDVKSGNVVQVATTDSGEGVEYLLSKGLLQNARQLVGLKVDD